MHNHLDAKNHYIEYRVIERVIDQLWVESKIPDENEKEYTQRFVFKEERSFKVGTY